MGTRAVVIDKRVEGKGFWVRYDGYPAVLGNQLRESFAIGKPIEQVYQDIFNMRVKAYQDYLIRVGRIEEHIDMTHDFLILTPAEVNAYKKGKLWAHYGIDSAYDYELRDDGVYVRGVTIPRFRKVKQNETDRGGL